MLRKRTRYSLGEWYGQNVETMAPHLRRQWARKEVAADGIIGNLCPFQKSKTCNKKGGVCTLRLYSQTGYGPVQGMDSPIAVCPNRFLEDGMIYRWVAESLLGTKEPVVLSEIGFLDRWRDLDSTDEEDSRDYIGRIDNVLLHPDRKPLDWCALEIQAVYFSGKAMKKEFEMMSRNPGDEFLYPAQHRRPDWRSSGPKRLLPQLQTKTPTIRTWGKKVAVVIDEPFFGSLVGLEKEKHLSNAEIVWFVVGYEPTATGWKMVPKQIVPTKLEASVKALTGGTPLPRARFEKQLLSKLQSVCPDSPLLME
jgi:hypothetical protein